jgi:hypothetical protein
MHFHRRKEGKLLRFFSKFVAHRKVANLIKNSKYYMPQQSFTPPPPPPPRTTFFRNGKNYAVTIFIIAIVIAAVIIGFLSVLNNFGLPTNNPANPTAPSFPVFLPIIPFEAVPAVEITAASAGTATALAIVLTTISQSSASTISSWSIPEPLKEFLKKFAEAKFEKKFEKQETLLPKQKKSFITGQELKALFFSIILSGLVAGFVKGGGFTNIFNLNYVSIFFEAGLISGIIIEVSGFIVESICSSTCGIQKKYHFWRIGVVTFLITGVVFMFPFSSSTKSTYAEPMPAKLKTQTILLKSFLTLTLTILFAVMALNKTGILPKIGDAGLLLILTSICSSLVPLAPLAGKEIYNYRKITSFAMLIPMLFLIITYQIRFIPNWEFSIVGIIAAILAQKVFNQLKTQNETSLLLPPPPLLTPPPQLPYT